MTDQPNEQSFPAAFNLFLRDEKKRYGHKNDTVPLVAVCDLSGPIIKFLLMVFMKLTLQQYMLIFVTKLLED